jgi:hypothetical protein
MWDFNQPYFEGKLISSDEAWRRIRAWRATGKEIGMWYAAKSGSIRALGTVDLARNSRLEISGSTLLAGFDLRGATFTYYPVQLYPRWPMGPIVEVMAVQAFLTTGEWLMLAEGFGLTGLPGPGLPPA